MKPSAKTTGWETIKETIMTHSRYHSSQNIPYVWRITSNWGCILKSNMGIARARLPNKVIRLWARKEFLVLLQYTGIFVSSSLPSSLKRESQSWNKGGDKKDQRACFMLIFVLPRIIFWIRQLEATWRISTDTVIKRKNQSHLCLKCLVMYVSCASMFPL